MRRSQYFSILLPAVAVLHGLVLALLALPTHGHPVSTGSVFIAIGLGLAGFGAMLCLRLILSLFPLSSVYTTSFLLFGVGLVEEVVHFLLLLPVETDTWHQAYIMGLSWSLAECVVSLVQLVPPKRYNYIRLPEDHMVGDEFVDPSALSRNVNDMSEDAQEFDLSNSEEAALLDPAVHDAPHADQRDAEAQRDRPHHHHHHHHHHHRHDGQLDPAAAFSAAAHITQQQREDPIAPLVGTSLLDLPTYFPFLWRTSALLHHLGFSLLLSLQGVGTGGVAAALIIVCLYRGVLRSIWGIGIMRFGVVTVTFLTLVGGMLSFVVGLSIWRAI
ncbi:uncharacterized protein V1518DRAFT_374833 [Limtongia smithiae]|uniref:uncharacterized protein n=1 Tax=Limtongia smithiae TaxID=1125753 RepID=UPI0034CD5B97